MGGDVRLAKLGTVMLGVSDLARSVAFYRDTLGLPLQFSAGEFAFFDGGGVTLCLRAVQGLAAPADERRVDLVFHVEDIQVAHGALSARGVLFRIAPRPVTGAQHAADFRDPDGNVLSIFGPRR